MRVLAVLTILVAGFFTMYVGRPAVSLLGVVREDPFLARTVVTLWVQVLIFTALGLSGLGLFFRKNWARRLWIGLMLGWIMLWASGILWLAGVTKRSFYDMELFGQTLGALVLSCAIPLAGVVFLMRRSVKTLFH